MTRNVMVVGGSGFIGTYVTRSLLERGDRVISYDLQEPKPELQFVLGEFMEKVQFERGSVLHLAEMIEVVKRNQIENIIYLSAIQDLDYANKHPVPVYELHLRGVINVLETAKLLGMERIVVGSTTGTYVPRQYEPMDEDHPIYMASGGHLTGHYGASKAAADIIALAYYSINDVDMIIARMSHVYGFGTWAKSYIRPAVENLVKGLPSNFETGAEALFDFTHVKDVARGILLCLDADIKKLSQRVYLIGFGKLSSGEDIANAFQELEPKIDVRVGPGMTERQRVSFRTTLDISAAREDLGYQPEFDLRNGIADYIAMQMEFEASKVT